MNESKALDPAIFEAERVAARGLPNVHFVDLTDQFCDGNICPAIQKGMVIYRDSNHITGRFADTLKPALETQLTSIVKASP